MHTRRASFSPPPRRHRPGHGHARTPRLVAPASTSRTPIHTVRRPEVMDLIATTKSPRDHVIGAIRTRMSTQPADVGVIQDLASGSPIWAPPWSATHDSPPPGMCYGWDGGARPLPHPEAAAGHMPWRRPPEGARCVGHPPVWPRGNLNPVSGVCLGRRRAIRVRAVRHRLGCLRISLRVRPALAPRVGVVLPAGPFCPSRLPTCG